MNDIAVGRRLCWKELPKNLRNILKIMGAIAGSCATIKDIIVEDPDSEVLIVYEDGKEVGRVEKAENLIKLRMEDGIPALIEVGQSELETSISTYETYGELISDGPQDKGGCWVKPINGSFLVMSCSEFEREVSLIEGRTASWRARNKEKIYSSPCEALID